MSEGNKGVRNLDRPVCAVPRRGSRLAVRKAEVKVEVESEAMRKVEVQVKVEFGDSTCGS